MKDDDLTGHIAISKYVDFSMRDTLERIDAYLNSKHISGEVDTRGRDKPFFNIVTAATNVWFRATDVDRKDVTVRATKRKHYAVAFVATVLLREWMRKSHFGRFLNDWGLALARYGSSVTKFVEKGGELHCEVIPWNRVICDSVNFEDNPQIERLWLTPAELKRRENYDQELVDKLLTALSTRKTSDGKNKDTKADYIELYEVHGEFPVSYLTDKESDDDKYSQQMHVVTFVESKEDGEFDDYTLFSGREEKSPYKASQ